MATRLEFLVAKLKVVLALATVSVAISSPVVVRNINGRECILTALGIFSEGSKT